MGPFLRGFCSELIKVARAPGQFYDQEAPGQQGVPASGPPTSERPIGAAAAPARPSENSGYLASIKSQTMSEDSRAYAHPKADTWRPSPKYKPEPEAAPAPKPSGKGGGGGGGGKVKGGMPWEETVRDPGMGAAGSTQKPDVRTTNEKMWGSLPEREDKPVRGAGKWDPATLKARGMDPRMATSSHVEPGMERDKVTRWPEPEDAKATQKRQTSDLMRGSRGSSPTQMYMKDNPFEGSLAAPRTARFATMKNTQMPKVPSMNSEDAQKFMGPEPEPAPAGPSNNELRKQWEQGGRQGPAPVMFE